MSFEITRIDQLCKERGISHYELAKMMGVTSSSIYNLFKRSSNPSIYTVRRICKVLDISLSQFFLTEEDTFIANKNQVEILKKYSSLTREGRKVTEAIMDYLVSFEKENNREQ